jgi:hypothetical protein
VLFQLRLTRIAKTMSLDGKTLQQFIKKHLKKYGVVPSIQKLHEHFPDLNVQDLALIQGKAQREIDEQ